MPLTTQLNYTSAIQESGVNVFVFDGTVSTGKSPFTNFPVNGFTCSCWVKSQQAASAETVVMMSYSPPASSATPSLYVQNPGNISISFGSSSVVTDVNIADNYWHYLAITIATSDSTHFLVSVYKDGFLEFSGTGALSRAADEGFVTDGSMVLGAGTVAGQTQLVGQMSEFRWYDGVLSASQVLTGMQIRSYGTTLIDWAMDSDTTSGTISGTPSFTASSLSYLNQNLTASWTDTGAATYNLQLTDINTGVVQLFPGLTGTGSSIPSGDFLVNHQYAAMVQPAGGAWSDAATANILNLQQILCTVSATLNGSTLTCTATWNAADQALAYLVSLYKNGSSTPDGTPATINTTTYDLTPEATSEDSWSFAFQSDTENALGPANAPVTPTAITEQFYFINDQNGSYLEMDWNSQSNISIYYAQVYKTINGTDTLVYQSLPSGTLNSFTITTTQLTCSEGDVLKGRIRAITTGTIGTWSNETQVIIHYFAGPTNLIMVADLSQQTITLTWQFAGSASAGFRAKLWKSGSNTPTYQTVPSGNTCIFSNVTMAEHDVFYAQVQAVEDNSYGLWSQQQSTTVGLSCSLNIPGVTPSGNGNGTLTVIWTNPECNNGTTFTVVICRAPNNTCPAYSNTNTSCQIVGQNISRSSSTQTSYNVEWSNTMFKDDPADTVYCVQVMASQDGFDGPWQQGDKTFTKNEVQPVDPGGGGNNPSGGDPVNLSSGTYSYSGADMVVPALLPLEFDTFYNTYTPIASENANYTGKPMGNRWNHTYNTKIITDSANQKLYLIWGTGNVVTYIIPSSVTGVYTQSGVPNGDTLYLGQYDNGNTNQYVLTKLNQTQYIFNTAGRLDEIISLTGKTTLQYSNNQLQSVTDSQFGSYINLQYDNNGRVKKLTDNTGRTVQYEYFANGDLKSRTDTCGKVRSFTYSDSSSSLMATASDQNGNTQNTFIKNTYDIQKRVIFQQDARAVADNEDYGYTFDYSEVTENGIDMVVANVTDRMSNTSVLKSIKANCNLVLATYNLDNNTIRQIANTYDGLNNLLTQTIYEGPSDQAASHTANAASYTYDGNRNLLSLSYPAPIGQVAAFTYNDDNQLSTYTDSAGNTTRYEYDGAGRLNKITNPIGDTLETTYYDTPALLNGLIKTIKSEAGNVRTYTYVNNSPYEVIITNPDGSSTRNEYDSLFRMKLSEHRDANTNVLKTVSTTYDDAGRILTQSTQYNGQSQANAYEKIYTYNDAGMLATYTDPLQSEWQFFYNPNDIIQQIIYPSVAGTTLTTLFEYNRNDNPATTIYAPGVQRQYTFDPVGRILTYTDGNDNVFDFSYGMDLNAAGPYPSVSNVLYPVYDQQHPTQYNTVLTTDCLGRVTSLVNPDGQVTTVAYSIISGNSGTFHQQVTYTLPPATLGGTSATVIETYDALGRIISYEDQAQRATQFAYTYQQDAANPAIYYTVLTITDPIGNQYIYAYSDNRRILRFTALNPDSTTAGVSAFSYDALGRILQASEQSGANSTIVTQYSYQYNTSTNQVEMMVGAPGGDAAKNVVLAFSGTGQQVSQTDASGNVTAYSYTPAGLLSAVTNAQNEIVSYGYDAAQRYNSLTQPGSNITLQILDGNGNNTETQSNGTTVIRRVFDKLNRMTSRTNAETAQTVGYDYNPMNKITSLIYPDAKTVAYRYDGLQQMSQVTDWNNNQTIYQYTPDGLLQSASLPNGTDTQYMYDAAGRMTGLTNKKAVSIISSIAYSNINALGYRGQMNSILPIAPGKNPVQDTMIYNDANELTTFNTTSLTYDAAGNTTTLPGNTGILQYNALGQLTSFGSDTYTYDADGLRTQTNINGRLSNYIQDINQYASPFISQASDSTRIQGIDIASGTYGITEFTPFSTQLLQSPTITSSTLYPTNTQENSALSRSLAATNAGYNVLATIFQLSLNNIAENAENRVLGLSITNGATQNYVYGQGLISSEDSNGSFRVYHYDTLGNTLALTDSNGKVTDKYAYDPFGNLTAQSGNYTNIFLFSGREGVIADANDLLFMRARYYDQSIQRFISRDYIFGSTFLPQTLNRYAYVTGNPVLFTDPLGLHGKDDSSKNRGWKIAGGVIGGAIGLGLLGLAGYALYNAYIASTAAAAVAETGIELQPLLSASESVGSIIPDGVANEAAGETDSLILRPGQSTTTRAGTTLTRRIPFSLRGGL